MPLSLDLELDLTLTPTQMATGGEYSVSTSADGRAPQTIRIKIPPGVPPGARLRIAGLGGFGVDGSRGDLYVRLNVVPSP
jgi:DnaJ-class molecular chaperone